MGLLPTPATPGRGGRRFERMNLPQNHGGSGLLMVINGYYIMVING